MHTLIIIGIRIINYIRKCLCEMKHPSTPCMKVQNSGIQNVCIPNKDF